MTTLKSIQINLKFDFLSYNPKISRISFLYEFLNGIISCHLILGSFLYTYHSIITLVYAKNVV